MRSILAVLRRCFDDFSGVYLGSLIKNGSSLYKEKSCSMLSLKV